MNKKKKKIKKIRKIRKISKTEKKKIVPKKFPGQKNYKPSGFKTDEEKIKIK